ncbi:MAG TPA: hypothetical protein PKZ76_16980 [Xanthomonadaceae bacterium]|jgi:hypothetical protein|nr:hypothetical protein [Xanthomonadaceae bacterium]
MKRDHPDFSSLTPAERAILFGPEDAPAPEVKEDEETKRERVRRRIMEAAEQEGFTLAEIFGPDFDKPPGLR